MTEPLRLIALWEDSDLPLKRLLRNTMGAPLSIDPSAWAKTNPLLNVTEFTAPATDERQITLKVLRTGPFKAALHSIRTTDADGQDEHHNSTWVLPLELNMHPTDITPIEIMTKLKSVAIVDHEDIDATGLFDPALPGESAYSRISTSIGMVLGTLARERLDLNLEEIESTLISPERENWQIRFSGNGRHLASTLLTGQSLPHIPTLYALNNPPEGDQGLFVTNPSPTISLSHNDPVAMMRAIAAVASLKKLCKASQVRKG